MSGVSNLEEVEADMKNVDSKLVKETKICRLSMSQNSLELTEKCDKTGLDGGLILFPTCAAASEERHQGTTDNIKMVATAGLTHEMCNIISSNNIELKNMKTDDNQSDNHLGNDKSLAWKNNGEAKNDLVTLLSALYAVILIILAMAFEVSPLLSNTNGHGQYEVYYVYIYGLSLFYLAYFYLFLMKREKFVPGLASVQGMMLKRNAEAPAPAISPPVDVQPVSKRTVSYSAPSAGSLYLRLGCIAFGLVGMVYQGLSIVEELQEGHKHAAVVCGRVFSFFFTFFQTYFIFENSKIVVHRYKSAAKFGMMHLVATNICVWIRNLIQEERHVSHRLQALEHHNLTDVHQDTDSRNHEHAVDGHANAGTKETHAHSHEASEESSREMSFFPEFMSPLMTACIVEYSLICAAVMYILWRNIGKHASSDKYRKNKHSFKVDCSSSSKGLFLGLLLFSTTVVSMVVFFVKVNVNEDMYALWIFRVSDSINYIVAICMCLAGFYKMKEHLYIPMQNDLLLLDDLLLCVGLFGQLCYCIFIIVPLCGIEVEHLDLSEQLREQSGVITGIILVTIIRLIQVLIQTVYMFTAQRLCMDVSADNTKKPGRQFVTFLLVINLALFLVNVFDMNQASSNTIMLDLFGQTAWTLIVSCTLPLCIFYRFHSSVCLAEIWKCAYKAPST